MPAVASGQPASGCDRSKCHRWHDGADSRRGLGLLPLESLEHVFETRESFGVVGDNHWLIIDQTVWLYVRCYRTSRG